MGIAMLHILLAGLQTSAYARSLHVLVTPLRDKDLDKQCVIVEALPLLDASLSAAACC